MIVARLDHLVLATRELERTVQWVGETLGVAPAPGGRHPGAGTRNFLLSLGPGQYLEVIGPDPDQPEPGTPRGFGIDALERARLMAWAAKSDRLEQDVAAAVHHGADLGQIREMSRATPDGGVLRWRATRFPGSGVAVIPFLIDWGDSRHPSTTAPAGASLTSFQAEHPVPEMVRKVLGALGLELDVRVGREPRLVVEVSGPAGVLQLE